MKTVIMYLKNHLTRMRYYRGIDRKYSDDLSGAGLEVPDNVQTRLEEYDQLINEMEDAIELLEEHNVIVC